MSGTLKSNPLWQATRDMHHACEHHEVGAAMATGHPPKQWYAAWLMALYQIHSAVDASLPESLRRVDLLALDLLAIDCPTLPLDSAADYAKQLTDSTALAGAAYVLTGAHLMGGEIMRRRLVCFPTQHLTWEDRKDALSELQILRSQTGIDLSALDCFKALLSVMDEIKIKYA